MHLAWTFTLIALGAAAGVLLGINAVGPYGAVLGVVPPTAVAIWRSWRDHQQKADMRKQLQILWERVNPRDDDFIAKLDALSGGGGDWRLPWNGPRR